MILLKEYVGYSSDKKNTIKESNYRFPLDNVKESTIVDKALKQTYKNTIATIEAIHCYPYATRNFTRYMPEAVVSSIKSWTEPYNIPLIKYHNEIDGEIVGRIIEANYKQDDTLSGTPCLEVKASITGYTNSAQVLDGTMLTVSIGVSCSDVRCSICGKQVDDPECDHFRGNEYENENGGIDTCYWDIYDMEAKELSYVIVPSDKYAQNTSVAEEYNDTESSSRSIAIKSKESSNIIKTEYNESNKDSEDNKDLSLTLQEGVQTEDMNNKDPKELDTTNEQLTESVKSLEEKVIELNKTITAKEAELESAKKLTEEAENSMGELEIKYKDALIETVQILRDLLDEPKIGEDIFKTRTTESLNDSIADLKLKFAQKELSKQEAIEPNIDSNIKKEPVLSEGLVNEEDDDKHTEPSKEPAAKKHLSATEALLEEYN